MLEHLSHCFYILQNLQDDPQTQAIGYTPQKITGGIGRPKFDVSVEQLEHLLHIGLNCSSIASSLGVSLRTVRRRMTEHGLSVRALYTSIDNSDLDSVVDEIKVIFPNCGYRMLDGHLRRRGIRITQKRVRESLNRRDPCGSAVRWATSIQRRRYHVAGPLSLWHIDGNHKLIRC